MIDAYVINLDRQIENYDRLKHAMDDLGGFNVQRVPAIDGKKGEHLPYIDSEAIWACKKICADSILGIALSHKKVAKIIYDSGVDYALVLEDDATPIKKDFHEKLQRTLAEVPDGWDIIHLYCQGTCIENSIIQSLSGGSMLAMLVSRNGAKKLMDTKIKNHIDVQTNFEMIKFKSKENIFEADESSSTNRTNIVTPSMTIKKFYF